MDRSLDEIIAERPKRRNRRGQGNRSNAPRDGVRKSYRERVDLDRDWVHDRFEDDERARPNRHEQRNRRTDRYSPDSEQPLTGARLRVDNLHYDLTEDDLQGLFTRIGQVSSVKIRFDRAGRSEGIAFVVYNNISDARTAIREFDGANAKGQPIRLTLLAPSNGSNRNGGRNPFDTVEKPKGSLFDRVEDPRGRNERSLSPVNGGGRRGGRRDEGQIRHSDVSKPPPDHIDRYVPGQRLSPVRRNGGGRGRRPGERREEKRRTDSQGRPVVQGRPRKTQEELDQEMDDYWGNNANAGEAATTSIEKPTSMPTAAAAALPAVADDDVDMIE